MQTKEEKAAYCKQWYRENRKKQIIYIKKWRKINPKKVLIYNEENKEKHKIHVKNYREKYPEKYKALNTVCNAIKNGNLSKPTQCIKCGKTSLECRLEYHHEDYSKPLNVIALCRKCHIKLHIEKKKENNN